MTHFPSRKLAAAILAVTLLAVSVAAARDCISHPITSLSIKPGFCAYTFGSFGGALRGIDLAPNNDLLVLVRGTASTPAAIKAIYETPGASDPSSVTLATLSGLNHAVKFKDGFVYASTDSTVYRWTYQGRNAMTNQQTVITGIPGGGHSTRTLEFGANDDWIYVSVGSGGNLDPDSSRSRVVRAHLNSSTTLPIEYGSMQVFADGLRNEVGIRLDPRNRLWGVENGIDYLDRFSTNPPLYYTNPAEEVNIFTQENAGKHYGYPYCWSEGIGENGNTLSFPSGMGNGTVWATNGASPTYTDTWCRTQTLPPVWAMQAHSAPLDIYFDKAARLHSGPVAVIPLHGSWNRPIDFKGGFRVDFLRLDNNYGIQGLETLIAFPKDDTYRPVAVVRGPCSSYGSCIFITDDYSSGKLIAIAEVSQSTPNAAHSPALQPSLAPLQGNTLAVTPDITLTYSIRNGILRTGLVNTGSSGWLAGGWKSIGNMAGTVPMLLNSTHAGFVEITDRTSSAILASWNSPSNDWGYTQIQGSIESGNQVLRFERPLICPEGASNTCVDIVADGTTEIQFIYAYHNTDVGNIETGTLAIHSMRGAVAVVLAAPPPSEEPTAAAPHREYKGLFALLLGFLFLLVR